MITNLHSIKKLSAIDLNLLVAFRVMDEFRHVTQAAKELGITQPALSHALQRLRELFGDALFVKSSEGMVRTPFAESIAGPIREILDKLNETVFEKEAFAPDTLQRTFRIRTTDLIDGLLMPSLIRELEKKAPGVRVSVTLTGSELPKKELETGAIDLAVSGLYGELPAGFYQQKVLEDSFLSAAKKDHPRIKSKTITLEQYCAERHLLISPGGELTGVVDKALRAKKKERLVIAGVSSFMVSGWITVQSDAVLTGPSKLLKQFEGYLPLRTFPPPLDLPDIKIVQIWHERNHADLAHKWFREMVRTLLDA